jgi:hypothetical protein
MPRLASEFRRVLTCGVALRQVASKKNFQLTPPGNADDIVFLFGKLRRNTYVCDFKPPMSCVQAFMAALSAFEHRMGIS